MGRGRATDAPAAPMERPVWIMQKGPRRAALVVRPHPLGTEAVVRVDGELVTACVMKAGESAELATMSTGWRQAFEAKGWAITSERTNG
jgi:hypothetical protein